MFVKIALEMMNVEAVAVCLPMIVEVVEEEVYDPRDGRVVCFVFFRGMCAAPLKSDWKP